MDEFGAWQAQLRKGAAELVVLGRLARKPSYGLALLQSINAGGELVTEGALYPLLNRLERTGRVTAEWVLPDGGGNPRKYYRLTDEGRRVAAAMHARWTVFRDQITASMEDGDDGR